MAGKVGRSGRKLLVDQERGQRIFAKAQMLIERALSSEEFTLKEKVALAKDIFLKQLAIKENFRDEPLQKDETKEVLADQLAFLEGIKIK